MKREIEFRAKDIFGSWKYGYLVKTDKDNLAIVSDVNEDWSTHRAMSFSLVQEESLGQYTGMCDKFFTKIYEGDIVLQQGYSGKEPMLVRFERGAFIVGYHRGSSTKSKPMLLNERCEVIGNIYDNPELINNFNK